MNPGDTARSLRSMTSALLGRPTEVDTSTMVPSLIRISVGPRIMSLWPSNSLPHTTTLLVISGLLGPLATIQTKLAVAADWPYRPDQVGFWTQPEGRSSRSEMPLESDHAKGIGFGGSCGNRQGNRRGVSVGGRQRLHVRHRPCRARCDGARTARPEDRHVRRRRSEADRSDDEGRGIAA